MPFGHNSTTYDVALPDRNVIVRTNLDANVFAKTEHNLTILGHLGLPVPRMLATDLTKKHYPFAYMLLEKIPGRDLRYELDDMTHAQTTRIAEQIVFFQHQVATLPIGEGYGYVPIGEQGPFSSWFELVQFEINRVPSTDDIPALAEWKVRVNSLLDKHKSYLEQVQPTCFLDDVTTKNVIVLNGELQGLIDFDCVCYGDPLWTIGLTKTAIVSDIGTKPLSYIDELCHIGQLTTEQHKIVDLYAAVHALDFMQRLMTKEGSKWVERMTNMIESC
jgi:aminoglycoside phosphotransferase (APT) family kinase protein